MILDNLKQIWPEWEIEDKPLGKGAYGKVYKATRKEHNIVSYSAIKVIAIPSESSEIDSLRSEGLDVAGTKSYLQSIVDDFVSEIQLMESLKGVQNIVSVEDYKVIERTDEIGWYIYIRMELLNSFNSYLCENKMDEKDVIKLGCDICTALEICGKRNVIHRDIKPENIFVNDFGDFKLGDFGVARRMENLTGGISQKGTYNYMAPEVAHSREYDARVDIYSLGLVLYRLLNANRLPFIDSEEKLMSYNERKIAVERRISGDKLPMPCDASKEMANVIQRACCYNPDARYSSASEMKQDLMKVLNGTYIISELDDLEKTVTISDSMPNDNKAFEQIKDDFGNQNNKKIEKKTNVFKGIISNVILVIRIIILCIGLFIGYKVVEKYGIFDSILNKNETTYSSQKIEKVDLLQQIEPHSTTSITMNWEKIENVSGYEVYRSDSKDGKFTLVTSVASESVKEGKLERGKTYYYKVRAYIKNDEECVYGEYSEVRAMGTKPQTPSVTLVHGEGKVKIIWDMIDDISGYEIYMSTSSDGEYAHIKTSGSKNTAYLKTELEREKEYFFKMRSYRTVGGERIYSSWSDEKSIITK